MKYTGFIFISALALATASCSSDSVDGDGDLFRRGAFEQTVDGTRMVFVASQENDNDVMFTWDRINQNYISNDITSANKYSGDITVPATVSHDGKQYNVKCVDDYSFFYCGKLVELHVKAAIPPEMESDFDNAANATLYVPKGSADLYNANEKWGQFANIIEEQ